MLIAAPKRMRSGSIFVMVVQDSAFLLNSQTKHRKRQPNNARKKANSGDESAMFFTNNPKLPQISMAVSSFPFAFIR